MNEKDRILINSYFDDDLTPQEIEYVEKLIETNSNANEYANKIKKANIEIASYFNSSDLKDLGLKLSSFVDDIKTEKNNINIFDLFSSYIFTQRFLSLSLASALFLSVGLNISNFYDLTDKGDDFNSSFSFEEFTDKNINIEYLSTKSYSYSDLDDLISQSIQKTIENKSLTSTINYGNKIYKLTLNNNIIDDYNVVCYTGTLISNDKKEFIFCNNNSILSISYK